MQGSWRRRVKVGGSRPTTRHKQRELEKENRELEMVEDMDTDELIEESSQLLSVKGDTIDQNELEADEQILNLSKKRTTKDKGKEKQIQEEMTNNNNNSDSNSNNSNNDNDNSDDNDSNSVIDKGKQKITPSPVILTKKSEKKGYDKKRTSDLSKKYPDEYWRFHADTNYHMVDPINDVHQLKQYPCSITDHDTISSMTLSEHGLLLATYSNTGSIKIWQIGEEIKFLTELRDKNERHIDEFYCGTFLLESPRLIITGGKLKNRYRWSEEDNDNLTMPCPLKIFDIVSGSVLATLYGHKKEIYSIKAVTFNGENYYISTSEDGQIIKWKMADDWHSLIESHKMEDDLSTVSFTVSFLPNTGNKYFMATCDEHFRLYDFENNKLLQSFENIYSSYCDCGKFIKWLDESFYWSTKKKRSDQLYAWFISRGTELCDGPNEISTKQNSCALHVLYYPKADGGEFILEEVKRFTHDEYYSNSFLVKITTNGRYILAPTNRGQYFAFNILTGQTTAIVKAHGDIEVRDVIFHPLRPYIFSCSDDGDVKVFTYKSELLPSDKEKRVNNTNKGK